MRKISNSTYQSSSASCYVTFIRNCLTTYQVSLIARGNTAVLVTFDGANAFVTNQGDCFTAYDEVRGTTFYYLTSVGRGVPDPDYVRHAILR